MKAIIMAGGGGKRLRPLTCAMPKPMVGILDRPMLDYTLELLFAHGYRHAAMTLGYLPAEVTGYYEQYKQLNIAFYVEDAPLGTAGGVKNAQSFIDGTFLVISGDALTDIDLTLMAKEHKQSGAKATIALKRMGNPQGYGVVITDAYGNVERFVEKPGWEDVFSDTINTGIYMVEQEVLDLIPDDEPFDFAKDLFPRMLNSKMKIYGHVTQGYWCDVGSIESYLNVHKDMLQAKVKANIKGLNTGGIWVGEGARINDNALIQPPAFIGDGAVIEAGVTVGRYSCIGAGSYIGAHSSISRSVLHKGARVGKNAILNGCVVAQGSAVGERCRVQEGAVVGEQCLLGQHSRISPRVRIWPGKNIGCGVNANENIIYGFGERMGLFGSEGFAGDLGVDLTPLRLSRLFGAVAEHMSGKAVAVSAQEPAVCNAAAKLAAGMLTLSGADVIRIDSANRPVLALCALMLQAKICILLRTRKNRLYADIFEPDIFMLGKAARTQIEQKYFNRGEMLAYAQCGKETLVGAAERFYMKEISNRIGLGAAADVKVAILGQRSIDALLQSILNECGIGTVFINNGGGHAMQANFGVRLNKAGTVNFLITPKGRILSSNECVLVWYFIIFSNYFKNTIKIPSGALRAIAALADVFGIEYTFASTEESLRELDIDHRRLLFDGIYAVCTLAEHIARTGTNIDEIASYFSAPHISVKAVRCNFEDIGRVISAMYAKGGAHADEGLRINFNKGSSYICPHTSKPSILIRAEADTFEFAQELCDTYSQMVKKLANNSQD